MTPATFALLGSLATGLAVGLGSVPMIALIDRLNRAYRIDLTDRMTRAGMDTATLDGWLRGRVLGGVVIWVVCWAALGMFPVGAMLAAFVYVLVPLLLERALTRHRTLLRDQLVTAVRALASQLRATAILVKGLTVVAEQTPFPLGPLLRRTMARHRAGMADLPAVLGELKDQLRMDTVSLFVVAVSTADRRGGGGKDGGISEVLDAIGNSLQENQRVERKREADTAAGRLLVNVLVVFPFVFLALFYLLDPDGTGSVFRTVLGQLVLCAVGGMSYLAMWIARRILGLAEV